jgi:hypothetical protein
MQLIQGRTIHQGHHTIHIQLVYTCWQVQYLEINKQVLLFPLVIDRTRKIYGMVQKYPRKLTL